MKYRNLIKLLSVLLCMVMLFTSCDTGNTPETEEVTTTQTTTTAEQPKEPVEPVLKNFFEIIDSDVPTVVLKDATRLEGEVVAYSNDGKVVILRNATVDFANQVTEVFTVYNSKMEKTVLSFTNSYSYGSKEFHGWPSPTLIFNGYDWESTMIHESTEPYQESAIDVSIENGMVGNYWIKVKKATLTPIDEAIREENEDGCAYEVQLAYEYYDVAGQKIVELNKEPIWWPSITDFQEVGYSGGGVTMIFTEETGEMIRCIEGENQKIVTSYNSETEDYGYYFGIQEAAVGAVSEYVEVYDKSSGEKLFRYYFEDANYSSSSYVLENGDILIQNLNYADEAVLDTYDILTDQGEKIVMDTYILDVETQKLTEIKCDFVINTCVVQSAWEKIKPFFENIQIDLTENVLNLAVAQPINGKNLGYNKIVCFDNEMNVMFELDPIVPEHKIGLGEYGFINFGFEILESGDYLVDLYNVVTPRAIVSKDGKLRSYLKDTDYIAGNYVVNQSAIFDYDGNKLYEFNEENEWIFERVFADNIIVSRQEEIYAEGADPAVDAPEEIITKYYTLTRENGLFASKKVFDNQTIVASDDAYLITQNTENNKYTIYNVNMEHVLTTANEIAVFENDGKYAAVTTVADQTLYYVLK